MIRQPLIRIAIPLALLCAGASLPSPSANAQIFNAQVFDFGQIDSFKSMGSGTQRGGAAPKTIVDNTDRHTIVITILESNTRRQDFLEVGGRKPADHIHPRNDRTGIPDRGPVQDRSARRRHAQRQIRLCAAAPEKQAGINLIGRLLLPAADPAAVTPPAVAMMMVVAVVAVIMDRQRLARAGSRADRSDRSREGAGWSGHTQTDGRQCSDENQPHWMSPSNCIPGQ